MTVYKLRLKGWNPLVVMANVLDDKFVVCEREFQPAYSLLKQNTCINYGLSYSTSYGFNIKTSDLL